ncbi:MAG: hypothetical protein ABIR27_11580 [Dokdonella sp.]
MNWQSIRRKSIAPFAVACTTICMIGVPAAHATTTAALPDWVCAHPDAIFVDGFQPADAITRLPSNGSGGATGNVSRTVNVPGYPPGTFTIYLHVPASYSPSHPVPIVLALHGYAGAGNAPAAAQSVRTLWTPVSDANGFILVVPIATGASGDWKLPPPNPSDYSIFAAAIADAESAYNIDRSRRIGWGFSAGGHVMHDIMFNDFGAPVSIDMFAAYSVSAGALQELACFGDNAAECNARVGAASRHIPIDIHVGTTDPLLPYATSDKNIFINNGWVLSQNLWFTTFTGGHTFATTQLSEAWSHLCPFQALP